jgi:hypothetical protein
MRTHLKHVVLVAMLFSADAWGQDIKLPDQAGTCSVGYLPDKGVCISSKALEEKGAEAIARQLMHFLAGNQTSKGKTRRRALCQSKIDDDNDDILKLANGAIVEITRGYLGYVGYRKDVLLFKAGSRWKLWIEGKKVFNVDLLRAPTSCRSPSTYPIEAAANDEVFIINGEKYEAQTYCLGWEEGESVVFLDGSAYGACASASLFNVDQMETCDVWCE